MQEIPGIGPTRKRALLHHFGTLKAIERASLDDLAQVPGINEETARKIYDFFHERGGLDTASFAVMALDVRAIRGDFARRNGRRG